MYRAEFASEKRRGLTVTFMIIFTIGYYVVFTFLPTYFIKTLHFTKTNAFVSITLASLVALVLVLPLAALSDRVGRGPMLIAAAVVSLLTILTLRETAGRPLPQGVADEMFQSGADVRGGGVHRVATELQLGRAAADRPRDAAQVDITRRRNSQPHRPCRRRADACAGRRGDDDRRRAGGQRVE